MGGMRGSSHKRVPVALKLPQLQVRFIVFFRRWIVQVRQPSFCLGFRQSSLGVDDSSAAHGSSCPVEGECSIPSIIHAMLSKVFSAEDGNEPAPVVPL